MRIITINYISAFSLEIEVAYFGFPKWIQKLTLYRILLDDRHIRLAFIIQGEGTRIIGMSMSQIFRWNVSQFLFPMSIVAFFLLRTHSL